eukprot:gnl/TRDRNA2_/TRDRNA2_192322_c0_seq1.p1 gnl/TRDRNA2_/TRDRNA2_192322_c0~~gnl/TRDRNA2_/TRDRNA2_192322_c0_seq1.p1  ORF type:complete len:628 (-),score=108.01 gnl/TRDRNA2_/TRDRNA2_192322_c0_seq1:95-1978(-)
MNDESETLAASAGIRQSDAAGQQENEVKRRRTTGGDAASSEKSTFLEVVPALTEALAVGEGDAVSARLERAEALLDSGYHDAAKVDAEAALGCLQANARAALASLPLLARACVVRAKALWQPVELRLARDEALEEAQVRTPLSEASAALELALRLDPHCESAAATLAALREQAAQFVEEDAATVEPSKDRHCAVAPEQQHDERKNEFDVVVVGAGAAGIGVALSFLSRFGLPRERLLVLERGSRVGESFRRWPREMRFISPSFNQQGWTRTFDLNSISYGTSPALSIGDEHPSGEQYADYLEGLARVNEVPISFGTEVTRIHPVGPPGEQRRFRVDVHAVNSPSLAAPCGLSLCCRFVVWAAGEFQYPRIAGAFPGAELCLHNSCVRSWSELPGDDFVVIGGYESGVDAAVNLARAGRRISLLASTPCWEEHHPDPSIDLAPYTRGRLREATAAKRHLQLHGGLRVKRVDHEEAAGGQYVVHAEKVPTPHETDEAPAKEISESRVFRTPTRPILCVGFEGSVAKLVPELFDWGASDDAGGCLAGAPRLTEQDESTKTEGLFLVGPSVRQGRLIFCFVYKFRQRFAVVAAAIARRLGLDTRDGVELCRETDMFLDDTEDVEAACEACC